MKLIIYGKGKVFERIASKVDFDSVVAIMDRKAEDGELYNDRIPVVKPDIIESFDYDLIVICTDLYFYSITRMLNGEYFVDENKIVSYHIYDNKSFVVDDMILDFIKSFSVENNVESLLDVGMVTWNKINHTVVEGVWYDDTSVFINYYRKVYSQSDNIENWYDTVLITYGYDKYFSVEQLRNVKCNRLIYILPYRFDMQIQIDYIKMITGKQIKHRIMLAESVCYIFENIKLEKEIDCKIYVVSHKRYNVLSSYLYIPICVGNKPWSKKYLSECVGDNIADYNDRLNECTALYWIWKNTKSSLVGLNHYRRYFYNNELQYPYNYITQNRIYKIFYEDGNDIILPKLLFLSMSLYDNIRNIVGNELTKKCYDVITNLMAEKHPEFLEAFMIVMCGNKLYPCNMFIAKREILDEYCNWLFSFIIEAADLVKTPQNDFYKRRAVGYFAETMMTCWVLVTQIKIYELPITNPNLP